MCEELFVCASQVYYFLFPFWFYCNRSNANFSSAISFSRMILSFSSLVYFNNLSQACISEINMSFLSLQRLWYESTNEYVTFLVYLYIHMFWLQCHILPLHMRYSPYITSICPQFCGHFIDIIIIQSVRFIVWNSHQLHFIITTWRTDHDSSTSCQARNTPKTRPAYQKVFLLDKHVFILVN